MMRNVICPDSLIRRILTFALRRQEQTVKFAPPRMLGIF
jgi:hypothetical protein